MTDIQIDINDKKYQKQVTTNIKRLAHRAFKKYKNNLPTTDYEKGLIVKFYPWVVSNE
jgi:hypothetical protein